MAKLEVDSKKKGEKVKVIFARHGSVGLINIYANDPNPHLTPDGLLQVMKIVEKVRQHKPKCIIASSFNRTVETAVTLSAGLNIPWTKEESIAGLNTSGANVAEFLAAIEASGMSWQWYWYEKGWPGLEPCLDYVSRTAKAILEILKAADGPVVLVGHWETYLALVSLIGIPIISALSTDVPNACAWVFDIDV